MPLRTGQLMMDLFQRSTYWKDLQGEEFDRFRDTLLSIGDDIVSVCEKYGLIYCLAFGSVLGAVRHKGFIPWDDDVDFFMPRKDYMKFMEVMQEEMGDKYYVRCIAKGDNIAANTCHVRLKGTKYVNYGDLVLTSNEPEETRGIYIDINPLDDSSDFALLRNLRGYLCLAVMFAASCVNVKESYEHLREMNVTISENEKKQLRLKVLLGKLFSFKSTVSWAKTYDRLTSYVKNEKSKYITCYTGYKKIKKSVFKREDILPPVKGNFEGRNWNIPKNANAFLTQIYGDYMTPPEGKHKIHPVFELEFGNKYKETV